MWHVTNSSYASIDRGIGGIDANGSISVYPSQTTTYTLTANGLNGSTIRCSATVTVAPVVVPPPPSTPKPVCTLSASPTTIGQGQTTLLRWTTGNATSVTLTPGLGAYPGVGETVVQPSQTTTYVLTASGAGGTVTCVTTVVVTGQPPVIPQAPVCSLTIVPTTISQGSAATLNWSSSNVSSASINQGIGAVSTYGGRVVAPGQTTTYTMTAVGTNGTVITCSTTLVVVTVPPPSQNPPTCTLSISPSGIRSGDSTTLTWNSTNATSFVIDQGVGSVSTSGSRTVFPGSSRTYVGTAYGPGGTATCSANVSINTSTAGPSCTLEVSPSRIDEGDDARLSWSSDRVYRVRIDQGIGEVSTNGSRRVSPGNGSRTYEGTFYGDNGDVIHCSATLRVRTTSGGGVVLDSLPLVSAQPLSYVSLSELPYTGLDLGPVGTALYWLMLILWSLALAYVFMGGLVPFALRAVGLAEPHHAAPVVHAPVHAPEVQATPVVATVHAPAPSKYEGFKVVAAAGPLTIDDIVNGLAREQDDSHLLPALPQSRTAPRAHLETSPTAMPTSVPAFLGALLAGEKETVFGMLRSITQAGEDAQAFLTHAVFALDDAYRGKTEGSPVHADVAKVCENCEPNVLERLIENLGTAVDSTYSTGTTAVKLAVTRALATIEG